MYVDIYILFEINPIDKYIYRDRSIYIYYTHYSRVNPFSNEPQAQLHDSSNKLIEANAQRKVNP